MQFLPVCFQKYTIVFLFLQVLASPIASGQDYFHARKLIINLVNLENCEVRPVFTMNEDYGRFINDIAYHPNGRIYGTTPLGLLEIDPVNWELLNYTPWNLLFLPSDYTNIIFDEEGIGLLSRREEDSEDDRYDNYHLYHFDTRNQSILWDMLYPRAIFNRQMILTAKVENYYVFGGIGLQDVQLLDLDNLEIINAGNWPMHGDGSLSQPALEYLPCDDYPGLVSTIGFVGAEGSGLVRFNIESGELNYLCDNEDVQKLNGHGQATTTDFRRSPLRIDLDGDNSSGHITAGYYDTLTTCRREVPLMDDVELYTCGGQVEYISFRLKYYDEPLLPEERIYSPDFPGELEHPSPGRYVWRNPYGDDESKIKVYLRSLRYRADWTGDNQKERVVMTTMHVGEDSTTSWSVFQLETDDIYAGRDTIITYCPGGTTIELTDYLSTSVRKDGRIEEALSSGNTGFTPGEDEDGEYLYILEKENCADTAVLTVVSLETGAAESGLDTVTMCPGGHQRIGFPPGHYDRIEWWDGSTGDSVTVSAGAMTDYYAIVSLGDCGVRIPITVQERELEGVAVRDTTIDYCGGGTRIDLELVLNLSADYRYTVSPALSGAVGDDLVFDPSVNGAGSYLLIAQAGSCADTAIITFQESPEQELSLDDIQLCEEQEIKIGLPPDMYQSITWWNGMSGDSTTIHSSDTGPFTVEAQSEGCTYRGTFQVFVRENIEFPESYPDTLKICPGDRRGITIQELDSIQHQGNTYLHGDQILFSQPGDYVLTGYTGGCSASKTITVTSLPDPSNGYSETVYWCERTPLSLSLPNDSAGLIFSWSDGLTVRERPVTATGEYRFDIQSGNCTFQSKYTVLANDESECDREECSVSIPNAITPNGDGWNDELKIFLSPECGSVESVTLWDKWGGLRYQTNLPYLDASVCEKLPAGTYLVQVSYVDELGQNNTVTESVLVIR